MTDTDKRAIEEMAKVLCPKVLTEYCASGNCTNPNCLVNAKALEILYKAGYRKQREARYCADPNYRTLGNCGECGGDVTCLNNYKSDWINVTEKNPEDVYGMDREKISVLVCTKSGKVSESTRCAAYKFDKQKLQYVRTGDFYWSGSKNVTHWMPMPLPPHKSDPEQEELPL
jgi:hypothetical protein